MVQAQIAWHRAEQLLMEADASDILGIFDCCDAGSLCNLRGPLRFEYLGACAIGDTTQPAGPNSFTRALIWALKEFKKSKKPFFTTGDLHRKIEEAPQFPKTQQPTIGQRITHSELITLAPAMEQAEVKLLNRKYSEQRKHQRHGAYLNLKLHFEEHVTDEVLKETAEVLHDLIQKDKIKAKQISFLEKHDRPSTRLFDIVRKVMVGPPYVDTPPETQVATPFTLDEHGTTTISASPTEIDTSERVAISPASEQCSKRAKSPSPHPDAKRRKIQD
jgi:hypothetical protein